MTGGRDRAEWLARNVVPHEPALRRWLLRQGLNRTDIDDIVQETYAVLAGVGDVGHIRKPRNYVFQTARSIMLQQFRRQKVVRFGPLPDEGAAIADDRGSPEDAAILRDTLRRADALLASMPDRVREAFVLRRIEGLSQREIAAAMQVSENTVEKHIGKALRTIMQAVASSDGGKHDLDVSSTTTAPRMSSSDGPNRKRRGRVNEPD